MSSMDKRRPHRHFSRQRRLSSTQRLGLAVSSFLLLLTAYQVLEFQHVNVAPNLISSSLENRMDNGKHDWMIVATMFSDQPRYIAAMAAQTDTWLEPVPQHRVFAVGPDVTLTQTPNGNAFPRIVPITRPDNELWMKRLQQFAEAHRMLRNGVDFDWFLSGNEDWYVNLEAMKATLDKYGVNPREEAVVYSGFGCGQHWEFHKDSKNNTLPEPQGWVNEFICEGVERHGGFCAGVGVVASKKAVELMFRNGEEALYKIAWDLPVRPTDDLVLSCVIYGLQDKVEQRAQIWSVGSRVEDLDSEVPTIIHAVAQNSPLTPDEFIRATHDRIKSKESSER